MLCCKPCKQALAREISPRVLLLRFSPLADIPPRPDAARTILQHPRAVETSREREQPRATIPRRVMVCC